MTNKNDKKLSSEIDKIREDLEKAVSKLFTADANMDFLRAEAHKIVVNKLTIQAKEHDCDFEITESKVCEKTNTYNVSIKIKPKITAPFFTGAVTLQDPNPFIAGEWAIDDIDDIYEILEVPDGFDVAVLTKNVETGEILRRYGKELKKIPKGKLTTLRALYGSGSKR